MVALLRSFFNAPWALFKESSEWIVLVDLYLLSLSRVDILHAIFASIFVIFLSFPLVRRRNWRALVRLRPLAVLVRVQRMLRPRV
jgi:hypothetical protein